MRRWETSLALALLLAGAPSPTAAAAPGGWSEVAEHFRRGRYAEAERARQVLGAQAAATAEGLFWTAQLATDPAIALQTWRAGLARTSLPTPLRARSAVEAARLLHAREQHAETLALLERARELDPDAWGGEPALIAQLSGAALRRTAAGAPPARPAAGAGGRFRLQLGAFSEAPRAEEFAAAWRGLLPDLRVSEESGPAGARLFKVRGGRYSTREEAAAEAARLREAHGLSVLVVEADRQP